MKILNIIRGWAKAYNIIKTSRLERKRAQERMKICLDCNYSKPVKILKILNGNENYENSLQCTLCKCPCYEKSLVTEEKCPENKWETG